MLTLKPYVFSGSGPQHDADMKAGAYQVEGLPRGVEANIVRAPRGWQIRLKKDGVPVDPEREYATEKEAPSVLEKEFGSLA